MRKSCSLQILLMKSPIRISGFSSFEAANHVLLNKSRGHSDNDLLFQENINYGFRRNAFALKNLGIASSIIGSLNGITHLIIANGESMVASHAILTSGVSFFLLLLWITTIKSSWVKSAAVIYAQQLVLSIDEK